MTTRCQTEKRGSFVYEGLIRPLPERAGERTLDPETVRLSADALGRDARSVAGETVLCDSRPRHPREYRRLRRSSYFRFAGHST
jgi:hypothetical protein